MTNGSGSFGLPDTAIKAKAREASRAEALSEAAGESAPGEAPSATEALVAELIPPKVWASVDNKSMTLDEFREKHKKVWDAVASKDHLMNGGRVHMSIDLLGTMIRLRSLNVREVRFLSMWQDRAHEGTDARIEADIRSMILQIDAINGQSYPVIKVELEKREEWEKLPQVVTLYDYLSGLDEGVMARIIAGMADLNQAKQLALLENTRHP